jgi:hypothetical protein
MFDLAIHLRDALSALSHSRAELDRVRQSLTWLVAKWHNEVSNSDLPAARNAYEEACVDCAGDLEALIAEPVVAGGAGESNGQG